MRIGRKSSNRSNVENANGSQVTENKERETGIELATSSLGIFTSIEYKHRRSPTCMQIQANQQLLSYPPLNARYLEGYSYGLAFFGFW
jgi:hypothetical protein